MANESTYPRAGDRTPSACAQREEHWRRLLARQQQSGLTQAAFCRREGVKENALSWWSRELRARDGDRAPAKVRRKHKPKSARASFVPVRVIQDVPERSVPAMEVVTRGGLVVRVPRDFDAAMLRRVVAALEGQPC